jgi:hypothetical protein
MSTECTSSYAPIMIGKDVALDGRVVGHRDIDPRFEN